MYRLNPHCNNPLTVSCVDGFCNRVLSIVDLSLIHIQSVSLPACLFFTFGFFFFRAAYTVLFPFDLKWFQCFFFHSKREKKLPDLLYVLCNVYIVIISLWSLLHRSDSIAICRNTYVFIVFCEEKWIRSELDAVCLHLGQNKGPKWKTPNKMLMYCNFRYVQIVCTRVHMCPTCAVYVRVQRRGRNLFLNFAQWNTRKKSNAFCTCYVQCTVQPHHITCLFCFIAARIYVLGMQNEAIFKE